ncbi:MAG TPA: hypothetical protein VNL91_11515 [Thermoanaerobaculia bacterium]|nr:hypothetical protein [Thermoanaerobaculia bacterium]
MRLRRRGEAGEGQAGCIVGLLVLLVAIFVAYKMVPVKVKAAELRQTVTDEAKSAGTRTDSQIMKSILANAEKNRLPVTEDNVKITRGANTINIRVEYTVPIEFPGFTYQWKFKYEYENPIF